MNINTNKYQYYDQVGCHNCAHKSVKMSDRKIKLVCGLDGIEVASFGICDKWSEGDDHYDEEEDEKDGQSEH